MALAAETMGLSECQGEENDTDATNILNPSSSTVQTVADNNIASFTTEARTGTPVDISKLSSLPLMYTTYTTRTANDSHFIRIDNNTATTQFTPINALTDQGFVFVQDLDPLPKVVATPDVVGQGTPVLVLNNTGKGVFEANVVFDHCSVQPAVPTACFQNLQALAHANLLQQTQEQIAKELGVDLEASKQKSEAKEFICEADGCGRSFTTTGYLKCHHQAVHSEEKLLRCNFDGCDRKFSWPTHLKYHQLTHTGERKYICSCDGCGKCFYTAQRLRVHARIHSGEKPFTCKEKGCQRTFSTAGNLKNHMRIHTGEKPYACTYEGCSKRFAEQSSLKKHKLVHSGERPYSCDVCGRKFSQSGSRNAHMKRHHLNKLAEQEVCQTQSNNVYVELADQSEVVLRQNGVEIQYPGITGTKPAVLPQGSKDNVMTLSDQVTTVSSQSTDEHVTLPHAVLGAEETLHDDLIQTDNGLVTTNVVVLSQLRDICTITGFPSQVGHREEIVYDSDFLHADLEQEKLANSIIGGSSERPCKNGMDPMMELDDI